MSLCLYNIVPRGVQKAFLHVEMKNVVEESSPGNVDSAEADVRMYNGE